MSETRCIIYLIFIRFPHNLFITNDDPDHKKSSRNGGPKVSRPCIRLLIAMGISVIIILIAAGSSDDFTGLDFLTYASYVKIGITMISFITQTWTNFQRTHTEELERNYRCTQTSTEEYMQPPRKTRQFKDMQNSTESFGEIPRSPEKYM